ncbi:MAG TPA: phage protease [Kiritimatiellia bacterium]|nr:phage protease [Kiritimatiellia bacterium]HMP33203.1 phage protease [Kiritimatiellia bacterium]
MSDLTKLDLICLRISNGASAVKGLPKRLKVLNWGVNETKKGKVIVGAKTVAELPTMQDRFGFDRVALDYEHNTVPGTTEYERTKEPREVAAYGVPLVIPNDGLYLDDLIYTPSGEKNALSYIDLSAAVSKDPNGEVVFMHSSALCRQGATPDVSYYSIDLTPKQKETTMELKDIIAGLTALNTTVDSQKAQLGQLLALSQTVTTQQTTITALSARLDKFERQALVDKATTAGKVIPLSAEELAKVDLVTLSAMVDKLPVTVPLSRRTPSSSVETPIEGNAQALKDRAAKVDARAAELQASGAATSLIQAYNMADQEIPPVTVK